MRTRLTASVGHTALGHVTDVQTQRVIFVEVLRQLGLDHQKIQYPNGGRLETPSDVTVTVAKPVLDLLA